MEKITEKRKKSGLHTFTRFGERERPYSESGANDNIFASSTKQRNHYMFVVDWQLDNENVKLP